VIQPYRAINDMITQKGGKLHFVQVITPDTASSARFTIEGKNAFIQNAFSNAAIPVYAHVVRRGGPSGRVVVTFEDVNTNARVIIGAHQKAATTSTGTGAAAPLEPLPQ
jgi:hypothetical protein